MKKKKILILGGGIAQLGLIDAAKKLGLEVIVVGIEGNYPGYKLADKVFNEDIFDKEAVLKIAKDENVSGITMCCTDFGLQTLGFLNDNLGLSGITEECSIYSSDKLKMKAQLASHHVNTAKFCILHDENDVEDAIHKLAFPLIVKAVDLQGSRGIYICNSKEEVYLNYKKSIKDSRKDYCIVEEFIEGREFGVQAFVQNGDIMMVQPHGDLTLRCGKAVVPVGHYMPISQEGLEISAIRNVVESSIYALGFNNCAINIDLIERDGVPYVIELTGRAGANSLPELLSEYFGFNYYEIIILNSLGESVRDYFSTSRDKRFTFMTRQLFSSKEGEIRRIQYKPVEGLVSATFFVKSGDYVCPFRNSNDCIGRAIFKGETKQLCDLAFERFSETFLLELI